MSTGYRVAGQGKRLTKASIERICKGWSLEHKPEEGEIVARSPAGNYVHLYQTSETCFHGFERFGRNSVEELLELLDENGFVVYSEYDDEF